MKEEHKTLLRDLIKEKKFPLKEFNCTDEEQLLVNDIVAENTKSEISSVMRQIIEELG